MSRPKCFFKEFIGRFLKMENGAAAPRARKKRYAFYRIYARMPAGTEILFAMKKRGDFSTSNRGIRHHGNRGKGP